MGPSAMTLCWEPVPDALGYILELQESGGTWTKVAEVTGLLVRKRNLLPGTVYAWRLAFRTSSSIISPWSDVATLETLASDTLQLAQPRICSADSASLTVEWDLCEGVTAYTLQFRGDGDLEWTTASTTVKQNRVRKKGLKPGRSYAFRVQPTTWSQPNEDSYAFSRASALQTVVWVAPMFESTWGNELVNTTGASVPVSSLAGKLVALLFSASWCHASGKYTTELLKQYHVVKAAGRAFEIVWISCDRDETSFWKHIYDVKMPWLAVSYSGWAREAAKTHFKVASTPRLIILSPSGRVITEDAQGIHLSLTVVDTWIAQG